MTEIISRNLSRRNTNIESGVKSKVALEKQSRSRIWCFTINNPDEKDESHLSQQNFLGFVKCLVWQIEEGKNNTPHIQGVVQFKNQMTFGNVKKKFPSAHLEVCRNFPASKLYCQKKEGRIKGPFFHPTVRAKMSHKDICLYMKRVFYIEVWGHPDVER